MVDKKKAGHPEDPSGISRIVRARIRLNKALGKIKRELEALEAQIREIEGKLQSIPASAPAGTLQEKFVKCGKPGCRCSKGKGHGPYYYLAVKEKGKTKTIYLGRELPEGYLSPKEHARLKAQLKELRRRRDSIVERLDRAIEILSNPTA